MVAKHGFFSFGKTCQHSSLRCCWGFAEDRCDAAGDLQKVGMAGPCWYGILKVCSSFPANLAIHIMFFSALPHGSQDHRVLMISLASRHLAGASGSPKVLGEKSEFAQAQASFPPLTVFVVGCRQFVPL
jgi:hypothetical protein